MDCQQAESLYGKNEEVKEEQDRLASISTQYQQAEPVETLEEEEGTIYSAIAAANDKYGAPSDDIGSGDRDPVDPAYGVSDIIQSVEPISTGYGVPRGEPLGVYRPPQGSRGRRKRKGVRGGQ